MKQKSNKEKEPFFDKGLKQLCIAGAVVFTAFYSLEFYLGKEELNNIAKYDSLEEAIYAAKKHVERFEEWNWYWKAADLGIYLAAKQYANRHEEQLQNTLYK